jgi:hypothetical protein
LFFVETDTVTDPVTDQAVADSNAAFSEGFGGEPAAPAEQATPAPEPAKAEPAAPDPWEGVSPALKTQFESLAAQSQREIDALKHQVSSNNGRMGALQKQLEAAQAAARATATAPNKRQITDAIRVPEKWAKLKEDFPEWVEAMDERLSAERESQAPAVDINGIKTEITGTLAQQIAEAEARARTYARIDVKHDGWQDTLKTPDFKAWFTKAPADMQALGASDKAGDAIKVLDAYEAHRTQAAEAAEAQAAKDAASKANEQRLRGALTPQGKARTGPTTPSAEDAFEDGFNS